MTGEKVLVLLHAKMEVCHFLNGCLEGFTLALKIGFSVYADLGVFPNPIKEIFKCCVVFEVIKFSRNAAYKEFSIIAVGCGEPNVGKQKRHYMPPIVIPSDIRRSSNASVIILSAIKSQTLG